MKSNKPTKAQLARFTRLAEAGCVVCGGPAEVHHANTGMGRRKDHDAVFQLCPQHHRTGGYGVALHAGKKAWEDKYGSEDYWLFMVVTI